MSQVRATQDDVVDQDPREVLSVASPSGADGPLAARPTHRKVLVLVEERHLMRESLQRYLQTSGFHVVAVGSMRHLVNADEDLSASVCLISSGGRTPVEMREDLEAGATLTAGVPVVLLSDQESPDMVLEVIEKGGRGLIPTSTPIEVALEAIRLVGAGGTFVPASSLAAARPPAETRAHALQARGATFTSQQAAIIEALSRGKTNKIIFYELGVRESTVKVHVRNIMRKLNARNRTEVAFLVNNS